MPSPSATLDLAISHYRMGEPDLAEKVSRHCLSIDQNNAGAWHLLAVMAFERGAFAAAVDLFRKAILLVPSDAIYLRNLGSAFRSAGRVDLGIASCRQALRLDPNDADSFVTLGNLGKEPSSEVDSISATAYRAALVLRPDHDRSMMNLANSMQSGGQFAEAETLYRRTLRNNPVNAEAHKNLAVALAEQGRLDEAELAIRTAIRYQPNEPGWRMALGQILLLAGQLNEGWKQYEWRWQANSVVNRPRGFPQRLWSGENTAGRVLIHAEQGLGDTLQFCRYLPLAGERAEIVLEVQRPLVGLLNRLPGVSRVVAAGDPLPDFDFHCPLLTLPRVMRTTLDTIPMQNPYLVADPTRVAAWRERLSNIQGLRVGLVWAGGIVTPRNRQRSISPDKLEMLSGIPGVRFISLQKYQVKDANRQSPPSCLNLIDWTSELQDFDETAALVEALDLVIGVDTAVAHLAAGLGKPVWLLNRLFPCWRWLLNREDSPWYPSLRQFRQTTLNDWDSVLNSVRGELARLSGETSRLLIG